MKRNQNVFAIALIAAILVGGVLIHYFAFTKPFPGHNDFLTPWVASRAYFYDGLDPYGDEVSLAIQQRIYGRPALPDEFPNHFAYPFYTTYFVWPLIHLDYAWATAIWMVVLEAALIGALFLLFDLYRYRPKPFTMVLLILFTLMSYPGGRGLVLGQISHVVFFLQVLVIWMIYREQDTLAGAVLAAATLKPQMVSLMVPLLLLWALSERRWRFLGSFSVVLGFLLLSSFLLLPDWVDGMIYQINLYPSYIIVSTPAWVVAEYLFDLGSGAEWIINLAFYALMLWTWYALLVQRQKERFLWTMVITLTVTHIVALRTATPHFVVFIIPLVFYLKQYSRRYSGRTFAVMLALFFVPWIYFLLTISETEFENPTNFLFLPLLTFAVLWFTRRLWWQAAPQLDSAVEVEHTRGEATA